MAGISVPGSSIKIVNAPSTGRIPGTGIKIAMGGGLSSSIPPGVAAALKAQKRTASDAGLPEGGNTDFWTQGTAPAKVAPPPPPPAWTPASVASTDDQIAQNALAQLMGIGSATKPGGDVTTLPFGGTIGAMPTSSSAGTTALAVRAPGELPPGGRIGELKAGATIGPPKADGPPPDWCPDLPPAQSSQVEDKSIADEIARLASSTLSVQLPATTAEALLNPSSLLPPPSEPNIAEQQLAAAQMQMMAQQEMQKAGEELQQLQALQMQQLAAQMGMGSASSTVEDTPLDQQLAVHQEISAAQQAQYLQQCQFQAQVRQYESQRNKGIDENGNVATLSRFKNGFRPIQLCQKLFRLGNCFRGDECTFAHALEELHPASPDLPKDHDSSAGTGALAEQSDKDDFTLQVPTMRMKKKREMCHRLSRGGCLLGKKCMFAHDESELGTVCLVITDRVKTAICKHWEAGKCIYGKYCVNAHGMDEIGMLKPPEDLCPPTSAYKKYPP